jgi:hypothetical protein
MEIFSRQDCSKQEIGPFVNSMTVIRPFVAKKRTASTRERDVLVLAA